jgi:hypothetical protein
VPVRTGPDIFPLDEDRNVARRGQGDAECLVATGLLAQLMVEMREAGDDKLSRRFELAQQMQERHGVGSAGHRGDDTRAGAGQIVLADRAPDAIKQHLDNQAGRAGLAGQAGKEEPNVLYCLPVYPAYLACPALFNRNEVPGDGFEPSTPRL